jgi:gluconokinase
MIIVMMGVSGAGKTTVGRMLADALGAEFLEGDAFHPPANVEKMRAGVPLADIDRIPWLNAMAAALDSRAGRARDVVIACSALRLAYRRILLGARRDTHFVYLKGPQALVARRLSARHGHYMPPSLLPSQFATLEEPGSDERAVVLDISQPPVALVARALAALRPDREDAASAKALRRPMAEPGA